jgi:DNA-directed RNA polymerase specialized sigma24 family protein
MAASATKSRAHGAGEAGCANSELPVSSLGRGSGAGRRSAMTVDDLYRTYSRRLLLRTLSRVQRYEDAEDACSFAWVQLHRYWDRVGERTPLEAFKWLTRHEVALIRRKRQREDVLGHGYVGDNGDEQAHDVDTRLALLAGGCTDDSILEFRELFAKTQALPRYGDRVGLFIRMLGLTYDQAGEAGEGGKTYTWVNRYVTEGRKALRDVAA